MRSTNRCDDQHGNTSLGWEDKAWVDQELDGAYFQDVRLGKRLRTLLGLMSNGIGQTIPLACQDWANTKAAYRFFSNPRISEEEILSGHFASTQARVAAIQERCSCCPLTVRSASLLR
jgi:Transposase DNA-binding